jgi:ribosomal protein L29
MAILRVDEIRNMSREERLDELDNLTSWQVTSACW